MIGFENGNESVVNSANGVGTHAELPRQLYLELTVREPEVVHELCRHAEGPPRHEYSLSALRLGVLALRQASGFIDSHAVREEGNRLLASVAELLAGHSERCFGSLSATLGQYFDPTNGDVPQRLHRLLKKDGDLEELLCRNLVGEASTLERTLIKYIGNESPLLRMLSPGQGDGVVASIKDVVQLALVAQREQILRQFSLDDKESALSRMISGLTDANGRLKKEFADDLTKIRNEFSLDNENGALSRLVRRVELAQQTIVDQFSQDNEGSVLARLTKLLENTNSKVDGSLTLDDEKSPLSRLRRELLQVIEQLSKGNTEFQTEVRATLESFKARREEAARSTTHGTEFQVVVGTVLQPVAQRLGDIFEPTGDKVGSKPYCKKGDFVIELGPDSAAPGARVACESKEDKSYDVATALEELKEVRENRKAQVGIFVFSAVTAPADIEPFARFGPDILVVWDRDNPATDILLRAALSVARALVVRERLARNQSEADFLEMDATLSKIVKDAGGLAQIKTWASTIHNNGKKIMDKAAKIEENLEKHIEVLREHVDRLREDTAGAMQQSLVSA